MSRLNKILIIIGVIVLIFAIVVIFWPQGKETRNKKQETVKMVPASVVVIPTQDKTPIYSTTGAKLTILPDDQYKLTILIYTLRQSCPIDNEYFSIIYDYKNDNFVVTTKAENMETFLQWKIDTGYNGIADKYWVIKND